MAEFPALPLWTDAYLADTRHLSTAQHGAYLLLLMEAWRRPRKTLPDDDALLAKLVSATADEWAALKPVVMAFWKRDGRSKEWGQKRLKIEAEYLATRRAMQRDRAAKRWNSEKKQDAVAMQAPHQSGNAASGIALSTPTPIKKESIAQQEAAPRPDEGFDKLKARCDRALALIGADAAKSPVWALTADLQRWIHAGADFESDILPAIAECMAKRKEKGEGAPSGWRYFEKPVAEARQRRLAGLPARSVNGAPADGQPRMMAAAAARAPFVPMPDPSAHLSPAQRAEMAERVKVRVMAAIKKPPPA